MNKTGPSDIEEISGLLHRYARAVDTSDWELYRSVFTDDAYIDYSSAGAATGPRDEIVDWFVAGWGMIEWSMHYITNVEVLSSDGDTATVRAMFYNPFHIKGMAEMSTCGGYYHHELLRTSDGWRSQRLVEENIWFANAPGAPAS